MARRAARATDRLSFAPPRRRVRRGTVVVAVVVALLLAALYVLGR